MKYIATIITSLFFVLPFAVLATEEITPEETSTESITTEDTTSGTEEPATEEMSVEEPSVEELSTEEKQDLFDELQEILFRALQIQLAQVSSITEATCPVLDRSLYIPDTGADVTQLQVFLKNLGPSIYPEGEVTGKYGTLTKDAVQRFQVLTGIFGPGQVGYGVTGPVTRKTISEYCENNTNISTVESESDIESIIIPTTTVQNSDVTISSSITNNQSLQNSSLFNPNSSSVFLQYLNPTEIQSNQPTISSGTSTPSVVLTPPSPISKNITFIDVPSTVSINEVYVVSFTESGFSGFDLVSIEGYKDDIQYFFGSTVPALGTYQIQIPEEFKEKDSFTLIIKHNNDIKDSQRVSIGSDTPVTD